MSTKWKSRTLSVGLFCILSWAIVAFIFHEISGWLFWSVAFAVAMIEVKLEEKRA